jgi:hypothetical protein
LVVLSPSVTWVDIDDEQWSNLWQRLYGAEHRPHRLIAVLEQGRPLALLDSQDGQIGLEHWPTSDLSPLEAAAHLRAELNADQVILVEAAALAELWDEQQRFVERDDDYDDYVFAIRRSTWEALSERATCDPPTADLPGYGTIQYEALRDLLANAVGADGSFLVSVFDGDTLWWTLAGEVIGGSISKLTSSQGLFPPGFPSPTETWGVTQSILIDACEAALGAVQFAIAIQLSSFERVLRSTEPDTTIQSIVDAGDALIHRRNE